MSKKSSRPVKAAVREAAQAGAAAPPAGWSPREFLESPVAHLLFLAAVALIAYGNTWHVPFVFDDHSSIVDNPVVRDLPAFLTGTGYAYNPRRFIGYLSFALNYRFGGLDTTGYHAVNLAVHICNGWLVYWLVRLTLQTPFFGTRKPGFGIREPRIETKNPESRIPNPGFLALLAALLFVAHPVQTQAVTYIVQRLTSFATLFYLLSLVLYIKARLIQQQFLVSDFELSVSRQKTRNQKPEIFLFLALSFAAALLAMRTKEIAFTLPLAAALYEFSFFGGNRKKLLLLLPLVLALLVIPLGMLQAGKPIGDLLSDVSEQTRVQTAIPRLHYLFTQFSVIVSYIRLLFFPVNQNLDYDYPIYDSLFTPRVFLSSLFLLALFGVAVWLYYRSGLGTRDSGSGNREKSADLRIPIPESRLIAFGILWFFLTLSVESSIIPIVDVIFEHRLYLPSVGAFLAVSAAAALLVERLGLRTLSACAALVVLALTAATWQRNLAWGDSLTLWQDTVAKSPGKGRAHSVLGEILFDRNRTDDAIGHYRRALSLDPDGLLVHVNLGAAYHRKGLLDQAIREYHAALPMKGHFAELHNNLGSAYNEQGLLDKAAAEYQTVLQQQPDNAMAHLNLGIVYHKKGELEPAIREFQATLQLDPASAPAHNAMGRAYVQARLLDRAIEQFKAAIALDPDDADSRNRLTNLQAVLEMMKEGRTARP